MKRYNPKKFMKEDKQFEVQINYSEDNYPGGSIIINIFPLVGDNKVYELPASYALFLKIAGLNAPIKDITFKGSKASTFLKSPVIKSLIELYY